MIKSDHQVLILDDEPRMLAVLECLLKANGYQVRPFRDPDEFLAAKLPEVPACLLLDNHLDARLSGMEVHAEIVRRGWMLPTIFLTAVWNAQSVVTAIRAGADAFLTKPFNPAELLEAVAAALQRAEAVHHLRDGLGDVRARAETLTKREREIIRQVISGKRNREIADSLDLALVTVKVHRAKAMSKLGAGNPSELARMVDQIADLLAQPGKSEP
jgi:FixJ family two-component response regulator